MGFLFGLIIGAAAWHFAGDYLAALAARLLDR